MTAEERAYGVRKALAFAFKTEREQIEVVAAAIRAAVSEERERIASWLEVQAEQIYELCLDTRDGSAERGYAKAIRSGELP